MEPKETQTEDGHHEVPGMTSQQHPHWLTDSWCTGRAVLNQSPIIILHSEISSAHSL